MPEKWKADETIMNRTTKKVTKKRHYLRSTPTQELEDYLSKSFKRAKLVQKVKKELSRRNSI